MKLGFLICFFFIAFANGANVVISSNRVAVIAGEGLGGLVSRQLPDGEEQIFFAVDQGITGFEDVAIDPDDPTKVFALRVSDPLVCSFVINDDASLQPISCILGFDIGPYSEISVKGGTLVISGGQGGFTSYEYDTATGELGESTNFEKLFPDIISHPGVLLLTDKKAALSTLYNDTATGLTQYGTMIVDLRVPVDERSFLVENSLGSEYAIQPANYPLENALYETASGQTFMITANGVLTIQDPYESGTPTEISSENFLAITVAVNKEKGALVLGGVDDETDTFSIRIYRLGDPMNPVLVDEISDVGRLTSVATYGSLVVYASSTSTGGGERETSYDFFNLPELPPAPSPTPGPPTASPKPSQSPTVTASPTITPSPTLSPTSSPISSGFTPEYGAAIFFSLVYFCIQMM
jgi:hypothetical protein